MFANLKGIPRIVKQSYFIKKCLINPMESEFNEILICIPK